MTPWCSLAVLVLLQAGPADLVIDGGTVVTMDGERRVLEDGALVIRGDRIVAVLDAETPRPEAKRTITAREHLVLPGLVNAHGHVPMVLFRGLADDMALLKWLNEFIFPAEARNVDEAFCYWGTLLAGIEMARSGTTTFSDMYYFEDAVARATDELGLRGVLGQTIIGFPAPDYASPAEALKGTEAFILKWKDHPRVFPSVAPHAFYTTDLEVVKQAAALAKKHGVLFQIHANESPAEDAEVKKRFGTTATRLLEQAGVLGEGVLLHHGITLTSEDIALVAERGATVSHNPESNMKGASGIADVTGLLKAGVSVGLGTDGGAGNNNLDVFEEIDTAAKLHKLHRRDPTALPAKEAVWMATMGGARALGLGDRIGSLEAGKLADVVLIDLRHPELTPLYDVYSQIAYAIKGAHVRHVIVGGKLVVQDRSMTTVDVAQVIQQARQLQEKIRASLEEARKEREAKSAEEGRGR